MKFFHILLIIAVLKYSSCGKLTSASDNELIGDVISTEDKTSNIEVRIDIECYHEF